MSILQRVVPGFLRHHLQRLRFPWLFGITALVLLVNVAVPDPLPFVDEILLALAGAILGSVRTRLPPG